MFTSSAWEEAEDCNEHDDVTGQKTIPRFSIVCDKETETLLPRAVLTVVPQCLKQV